MAEPPPLMGGVEPESRDHGVGEVEEMEVELGSSARSALSRGEEGEVHLNDKSCTKAGVQALLSANAAVEAVEAVWLEVTSRPMG